jgi:UDP-glucose 4-epimerase
MPSALVTGGAGFIGSHLVTALLKRGYSVRVLDNLSSGKLANLEPMRNEIEFIQGDIRDRKQVIEAVHGMDVVFHLAAQVSVVESMQDPADCFDTNVSGTNLVLQAASRANVARVVLSSSSAVYGDQELLPTPESVELRPLSPYAASKWMDETMAGLYTRSFNLPVICLRYFNVFGPRQDPASPYAAAIPIFIRRLLQGQSPILYGDGGQTRDFIYVTDVARANILAVEKAPHTGAVMNICSGRQVSILRLLAEIQRLIPNNQRIDMQPARAGDIYHSLGDPALARALMGFSAETNLIEGLTQTIEWMQK